MPKFRAAAKVALSVCAGLLTGAATGFAAALLRPRPGTHYVNALHQPVASDDDQTSH